MSRKNPAAVVVGSGLNALGVVRSLAAATIPIQLVCAERDAAIFTRHARKILIESTGGDYLIEALIEIGKHSTEKPVLFLTEEKSVETVSAQRAEILPFFRIRLPKDTLLTALMHKQGIQEIASTHSSLIPPAVYLRGEEDIPALSSLRYPCVLKPAVKNYSYGALFQKAYVVLSAEEATERYLEILPTLADMVVQEWIEGSDSDIYFCLQYVGSDGATVASFVGRKIRSWPPRIGGTASCTCAPDHAEELTTMTSLFFRQVGFVGMGSVEYKRDSRDGRFYMVEPTVGRTDFQEEVATIHGINIPLAAYCHEAGLPAPTLLHTTEKLLWREPVVDRWSSELQPEIENPPDTRVVDAYWRTNDPMPWMSMIWGRVKGKIERIR